MRISVVTVMVLLGTWGGFAPVGRAEEDTRTDQLKAAYLFNFVKFVDWPASVPAETLTVCFLGSGGVHDALSPGLENKRAGARRLVLRRLDRAKPAVTGCNVLYSEAAAVAGGGPLPGVGEPGLLTVSDLRGYARNGGMIELFTEGNRLRFSINVDNALAAGLRLDSGLLQLAATIEKRESK